MATRRNLILAGFVFCFISSVASANSIPISGVGLQGQPGSCCFNGDFFIAGPGLSLSQGTPDGPISIGFCTVDTVCNFSYSIGNASTFCSYCLGFSGGSLGTTTADFLDASLTFTGSAFYPGGLSTMSVPMSVSGTIIGYKLVSCTDGVGCSLGPIVFDLQISGSGMGTVTFLPVDTIAGIRTSFTGTATVVPEPTSLWLMVTGLAGLLLRKRSGPPANMTPR
jgi:PEP-CTERM motif